MCDHDAADPRVIAQPPRLALWARAVRLEPAYAERLRPHAALGRHASQGHDWPLLSHGTALREGSKSNGRQGRPGERNTRWQAGTTLRALLVVAQQHVWRGSASTAFSHLVVDACVVGVNHQGLTGPIDLHHPSSCDKVTRAEPLFPPRRLPAVCLPPLLLLQAHRWVLGGLFAKPPSCGTRRDGPPPRCRCNLGPPRHRQTTPTTHPSHQRTCQSSAAGVHTLYHTPAFRHLPALQVHPSREAPAAASRLGRRRTPPPHLHRHRLRHRPPRAAGTDTTRSPWQPTPWQRDCCGA